MQSNAANDSGERYLIDDLMAHVRPPTQSQRHTNQHQNWAFWAEDLQETGTKMDCLGRGCVEVLQQWTE